MRTFWWVVSGVFVFSVIFSALWITAEVIGHWLANRKYGTGGPARFEKRHPPITDPDGGRRGD